MYPIYIGPRKAKEFAFTGEAILAPEAERLGLVNHVYPGERLEDVIMLAVPGPEDKEAILAGGPPWFTTSHFDGYNAVLVQESRLSELTRDELDEVIQDAWLAKAPRRLAKEWLAARDE